MKVTLLPGPLSGSMAVPPSKSMAHRLMVCAALSRGPSQIAPVEDSQDILATKRALTALGASFDQEGSTANVSPAPFPFAAPASPVHCGESGSTLRFLIPLFSLCGAPVFLTGAPSLFSRPLGVYADLFAQQQLVFSPRPDGLLLQGPLRPGSFQLPGDVSSQFISGLLFALPLLSEGSTIHLTTALESAGYLQMTIAALASFGIQIEQDSNLKLRMPGRQTYRACSSCTVEGDWSQGVVPAVLSAVLGPLPIEGLSAHSLQGDKALVDILSRCGAECRWDAAGRMTVYTGEEGLHTPGFVDLSDCPDLGPVLAALALFCRGTTRFVGAGRLRIKESDRIASIQQEFGKMGAVVRAGADWFEVEGPAVLHCAAVHGHNDHRVVMALAVASLCAGLPLPIEGAEAISKSWPGFFAALQACGVNIAFDGA